MLCLLPGTFVDTYMIVIWFIHIMGFYHMRIRIPADSIDEIRRSEHGDFGTEIIIMPFQIIRVDVECIIYVHSDFVIIES